MPEYLYIRSNPDWLDKYKFGYTSSENGLRERYKASITEHSEYSKYERVFEIQKLDTYKGYKEFDKIFSVGCRTKEIPENLPLLKQMKDYLVEGRDKSEFIKKEGLNLMEQIVKTEFLELGLNFVKSFSQEELREYEQMFQREYESENGVSEVFEFWEKKKSEDLSLREYQRNIIDDMEQILLKDSKVFLELATGGGKSFIVYNLFKRLSYDFIIIFSPRTKINQQNVSDKYLKILNNETTVYHTSSIHESYILDTDNKSIKILVSCVQSLQKVHKIILANNLKNIVIWFDEAHHTVENWSHLKEKSDEIKFFLKDNERIKYRIYTSASPNSKTLTSKTDIFGIHYKNISVKQLIDEKWLCNLTPYVYHTDMKNDVEILDFILKNFDKNYGLSFHNKRENAKNLFEIHYKKFKKGDTQIKPFLLLGDDYQKPENCDPCFLSLENYQKTPDSIGYVVQKYSMGYDFEYIDFLIFSDPKSSYKDIIQSLGRGLRSDKLDNGKNKEKNLKVMIPVYYNEEKENDFTKVIKILEYIMNELKIPFKEILENSRNGVKTPDSKSEKTNKKYTGEEVLSKVFDVMINGKNITIKKFIDILKDQEITNIESYQQFRQDKPDLNLPENPILKYNKKFTWDMLCKEESYFSRKDCILEISRIKNADEINGNYYLEEEEDEDEKTKYLHSRNKRIPNQYLVNFYGGSRSDYLIYD